MTKIVVPAEIPVTILRDPDDDVVLATALAAQADLIVSGDMHLLNLSHFQNIEIVTPAIALDRVEREQT